MEPHFVLKTVAIPVTSYDTVIRIAIPLIPPIIHVDICTFLPFSYTLLTRAPSLLPSLSSRFVSSSSSVRQPFRKKQLTFMAIFVCCKLILCATLLCFALLCFILFCFALLCFCCPFICLRHVCGVWGLGDIDVAPPSCIDHHCGVSVHRYGRF